MSARPSMFRSTTTRLAIAGAASLATLLASAPMAVAEDDIAPSTAEPTTGHTADEPAVEPVAEPTPEPTAEAETEPTAEPEPETPSPALVDETPAAPDEAPAEVPAEVPAAPAPSSPAPSSAPTAPEKDAAPAVERGIVAPNYGTQKFRVGVQIADGSYVPAGTTTLGTEFTMTQTDLGGTVTTFTCTTTIETSPTGSECDARVDVPAGASVTIAQTSATPGLARSTHVETLAPCETGDESPEIASCPNSPTTLQFTFTNKGSVVPQTTPDAASTSSGEPITIDVLANDDNEDPDTSLSISTPPAHGTAVVTGAPAVGIAAVGGAGTLAILYTPTAGFSGTDSFEYAVTNSNGTTRGTVSVQVNQPAVVPPIVAPIVAPIVTPDVDPISDDETDDETDVRDDSAADEPKSDTTDPDTAAALPDTGGFDASLLGYGALLLAGGAAMTITGRRRPKQHDLVG